MSIAFPLAQHAMETTPAGARLEMESVSKRYGEIVALDPLTLDVDPGTFLSVLGPSGSGKTTVLRLIGGFTAPSSGRIRLGGQDITDLPIFQRPSNTVFQDYALFPHLSVAANVGYGLSVRGRPAGEIKHKVEEILAVVGLETMAGRAPAQLSGGQRQRVALARALICEPKIMLLDEPLAALDAELRRQMQDFLKSQQRRTGITFLFVTHDQQEAIGVSDLILVMQKGRVEQVASPRELYYRPKTLFVAGFFGENNLLPGRVVAVSGTAAQIETAMGRFKAENPHGCKVGDQASLAIRPETVELSPATGGLAGTVTDISFRGSATCVTADIGGRGRLLSIGPSDRHEPNWQPGQVIRLGWPETAALLVPY